MFQICKIWHERRQGTYHVVFVRGRVCDRLSQLPLRASGPDHYRGDDAQPCAPCHGRTDAAEFFDERSDKVDYRQNMQTMELRSVIGELILRQHRACYLDLHRATARERYEFLLWQATKGRAAATSLSQHRASPCLAGPRLFSLRHAQLPEYHPQGYHVRSEKIAPLSLSSLRLSLSAPDFRALPRAFLCRFPEFP